MTEDNRSFLGRGWSFPPAFDRSSGSVKMVADEADITESLAILLATSVGERFLVPNFGCNLRDLMFEPLNTSMQTYMKGLITQAVLHHEPRIDVLNIAFQPGPDSAHYVDICLDYRVRATNSRHNMVYPFYLNEASRG